MIMSENANSRYSSKNPSKYQTLMIQLHERFPGLEEYGIRFQIEYKFKSNMNSIRILEVFYHYFYYLTGRISFNLEKSFEMKLEL